jgi:hypothetical protein
MNNECDVYVRVFVCVCCYALVRNRKYTTINKLYYQLPCRWSDDLRRTAGGSWMRVTEDRAR